MLQLRYLYTFVIGFAYKLRIQNQHSASKFGLVTMSNKKAQLMQRERAAAVHVLRPTANKCKIRKNLYFSAQGHSRSLLSVSIETRV